MQRKPIRKISNKKRAQLKAERILTARLIIRQEGKCADCKEKLGFGSAKHEIIFRSHGGDPLDEKNTVLLCLVCHGKRHRLNLIMEEG